MKTYVTAWNSQQRSCHAAIDLNLAITTAEPEMADEINQILTPVDIEAEMKKSYLDYAMSVIVAARCPTCATD